MFNANGIGLRVLGAGLVLVSALSAQTPTHRLKGPVPNPAAYDRPDFATEVMALDDAGGTTTALAIVGDDFTQNSSQVLEVRELDGTLRWRRAAPAEFSPYGYPTLLATAPDLDGDQVPDLYVGGVLDDLVEILSGASGARIDLLSSPTLLLGNGFGSRAVHLGDMDGDGAQEFAIEGEVGLALYRFSGGTSSFVSFLAGIHAGVLPGPAASEIVVDNGFQTLFYTLTGSQLVLQRTYVERHLWAYPAGDVTGDGRIDLLLHAGSDVRMLDGANLATVWLKDESGRTLLTGFSADAAFGSTIAVGQDLNGNGIPDVAVADPYHYASNPLRAEGAVFVYEGASGQEIGAVFGTVDYNNLGRGLALASGFLSHQVPTLLLGVPSPEGLLTFPATQPGELRGYTFQATPPAPAPAACLQVDRIDDSYVISGATPGTMGFVGASLGTTTFAGQTVVDVFSPTSLLAILPIVFDAQGSFAIPLPVTGSFAFYLQAIDDRAILSPLTSWEFF